MHCLLSLHEALSGRLWGVGVIVGVGVGVSVAVGVWVGCTHVPGQTVEKPAAPPSPRPGKTSASQPLVLLESQTRPRLQTGPLSQHIWLTAPHSTGFHAIARPAARASTTSISPIRTMAVRLPQTAARVKVTDPNCAGDAWRNRRQREIAARPLGHQRAQSGCNAPANAGTTRATRLDPWTP
jgi:hypothetical protein